MVRKAFHLDGSSKKVERVHFSTVCELSARWETAVSERPIAPSVFDDESHQKLCCTLASTVL